MKMMRIIVIVSRKVTAKVKVTPPSFIQPLSNHVCGFVVIVGVLGYSDKSKQLFQRPGRKSLADDLAARR
jgi:hypothetical protein